MEFEHTLNGHAVGIVMKELVRRAISTIRRERIAFEVTQKVGYGGDMDDILTSVDLAAQKVYVKSLEECFPQFGIISEEGVTAPGETYFTIDPLDGTKAFVRKQSHGVGTMIALVRDGEVLGTFIGDVNTGEIFGYRPGSDHVHRLTDLDVSERLDANPQIKRGEKNYLLMRDPPEEFGLIETLVSRFDSHLIDGGSIGTWMARLWKREIIAVHMGSGHETPWDSSPIIGITKKLGYVFLRPTVCCSHWEEFDMIPPKQITARADDVVIIHRNDLERFNLLG